MEEFSTMHIRRIASELVDFILVEDETGETVKLTPESHPEYFDNKEYRIDDQIFFDGVENTVIGITIRKNGTYVVAWTKY